MVVRILLLLAATTLWISAVLGQSKSCSGSQAMCLQTLRDFLTRTDWWFGDSYNSTCPVMGGDKRYACLNPDREHNTIISRILQTSNVDVGNITQILHVRFYVPAGSYLACGHRFDVPTVYMIEDIDFSMVTYLDSWTLRNRPAIIWDPEPGIVYTLIAYNVDHLLIAGMWVNIKGGDSAMGYEIYPYQGPVVTLTRTSFHAFVLFRQSELISGKQLDVMKEYVPEMRRMHGELDKLKSLTVLLGQILGPVVTLTRTSFHAFVLFRQSELISGKQLDVMKEYVPEMRRMHGELDKLKSLTVLLGQILDPMGVGLITVGPDPYGIEKYKLKAIHNNCPWLIGRMRPLLQQLLHVHNLTSTVADVNNLEVEVEVMYASSAIEYTSCCSTRSESARTFQLDALSQSSVRPVFLRSQPLVRFVPVDMMDQTFLLDKLYSILLLDITWAITGSRQTSLLWHVTDIPGQYVTFGTIQKEYTTPLPPLDRRSNSLYILFVLRQSTTIGNYSINSYCSTTSNMKSNNCDFNLFKYVQDHQLHLSGVTWFWSQTDHYSRLKLYEADPTKMDTACKGISRYGQPCPDKCASPPTTAATANEASVNVTKASNGSTHKMASVFTFAMCVAMWETR